MELVMEHVNGDFESRKISDRSEQEVLKKSEREGTLKSVIENTYADGAELTSASLRY